MNYWIDKEERKKFDFRTISISANNLNELITKGQNLELKYLIAYDHDTPIHNYVNKIYDNETNYPFLIKIFDSNDLGYTKLKIKIFEIDYVKFYELMR